MQSSYKIPANLNSEYEGAVPVGNFTSVLCKTILR